MPVMARAGDWITFPLLRGRALSESVRRVSFKAAGTARSVCPCASARGFSRGWSAPAPDSARLPAHARACRPGAWFCLAVWLLIPGVLWAAGNPAEDHDTRDRTEPGGVSNLSNWARADDPPWSDPDPRLNLAGPGSDRARALTAFARASAAERNGDVTGALTAYRRLLELDPAAWTVARRAALLAARSGDAAGGLELLEQALAANDDQPGAWLQLAAFLQVWAEQLGTTPERGRDLLDQALDRFPWEPEVYEVGHRFHMAGGDRRWAQRRLEDALGRDETSPAFWLRLGRVAQDVWPLRHSSEAAHHLDQVNRFYQRALAAALAADESASALRVADYFALTDQTERAIAVCEELVARGREVIAARERLMTMWENSGRMEEAIGQARLLVEAEPHNPVRRRQAAGLLEDDRRYVEAAAELEAAIDLAGGNERDHLDLARLSSYDRETDRFLRVTRRARELFPGSARVAWAAALAASAGREHEEALPHFEACVELVGRADEDLLNNTFFFNFGAALERNGRFDDAAVKFAKAIELTDPEEQPERLAQTLNYLGYMWLDRDENLEEAGRMIIEANRLVPGEPAYIDSLGWYFFKIGKFEQAYGHLSEALELLDDEPDAVILDHAAQALAAKGRFDDAVRYSARAVELAEDDDLEEFEARLEDYRARAQQQGDGLDNAAAPGD